MVNWFKEEDKRQCKQNDNTDHKGHNVSECDDNC